MILDKWVRIFNSGNVSDIIDLYTNESSLISTFEGIFINDKEGINLMNDSPYGLTASIWTKDIEAAQKLGNEVNTGTLFMNRCDYLDPGLSWTGVKETGKGCSLSEIAFEHLTKPKSFHLRKELK